MTFLKHRKWWVLFVTTSATSLVMLDNTVMPVALPTIQKELGFSALGLIWVVNSYLLSLTALLLVGGRLSDLFGRRTLFMWGLSLFGLGSLIAGCGFVQWPIILGRVVQGLGGAFMIPATGALLVSTFGEGERAKAIGINTGISSVFLILGPAVGGFLTQYISWRSIFFINLPIVLFGITMGAFILKSEERKKESFHYAGALTMLFGTAALVVSLMQGNTWGWTSPEILILLIAAPVSFILFGKLSARAKHPLVDFHFFRKLPFSLANLSMFFSQIVVMATVLWAIYFQKQLHYSATQTGLLLFIATSPVFLMAPLGGFLSDKVGPRTPLLFGYGVLTLGLVLLLFSVGSSDMLKILPGLLGFGCGISLIMPPTMSLVYAGIDPAKLGAVASISTKIRQLAATVGIALMTAVYQGVVHSKASHIEAFFAITLLAAILAFSTFWLIFFLVQHKN